MKIEILLCGRTPCSLVKVVWSTTGFSIRRDVGYYWNDIVDSMGEHCSDWFHGLMALNLIWVIGLGPWSPTSSKVHTEGKAILQATVCRNTSVMGQRHNETDA
jgi:hypothetical protein